MSYTLEMHTKNGSATYHGFTIKEAWDMAMRHMDADRRNHILWTKEQRPGYDAVWTSGSYLISIREK